MTQLTEKRSGLALNWMLDVPYSSRAYHLTNVPVARTKR